MFVAEKNFKYMIDEAKSITLMTRCRLAKVNMDGSTIQSIDVSCNKESFVYDNNNTFEKDIENVTRA